jgi:hypothetical protein
MTTTTKTAPASPEPGGAWSGVDTALWCYLVLPLPIFLLGFFHPALGLPLTGLALAAAWHFLPRRTAAQPARPGALGRLRAARPAGGGLGRAGRRRPPVPCQWQSTGCRASRCCATSSSKPGHPATPLATAYSCCARRWPTTCRRPCWPTPPACRRRTGCCWAGPGSALPSSSAPRSPAAAPQAAARPGLRLRQRARRARPVAAHRQPALADPAHRMVGRRPAVFVEHDAAVLGAKSRPRRLDHRRLAVAFPRPPGLSGAPAGYCSCH